MHYAEIAQVKIDSGHRVNVGATPAATVSGNLSVLIRGGRKSPVVRVERGVYAIRDARTNLVSHHVEDTDEAQEDARKMGLINAFGMFWDRDGVRWRTRRTRVLGVQQSGSASVDFADQVGVYVLYDGSRALYVGRVTEPRMGQRLFEHTRDRLSG